MTAPVAELSLSQYLGQIGGGKLPAPVTHGDADDIRALRAAQDAYLECLRVVAKRLGPAGNKATASCRFSVTWGTELVTEAAKEADNGAR